MVGMGIAVAGIGIYAEVPADFRLPQGYDPFNLNYSFSPEQLKALQGEAPAAAPQTMKHGRMTEIKREGAETPQYFVAAQTYHKDYVFNYEGGAVTTYDIGVKVDGDKVTISNFFNLEAQSTEWMQGEDWDVEGVYDAEAHTVTIPALQDYESSTKCGKIGDTYICILAAGEVNAQGQMAPADELVFNVVGDFEALTTDMDFGIMNYIEAAGMAYGFQTMYRNFYASLPGDEPKLIAFNNSFEFGQTYPNTPATKTVTVFNVSGVDADYAVNVESDGNAFSATPEAGVIDAKSCLEYTLTFNTPEVGEYEGLASVMYEGVAEDPQPIDVLMFGEVIPFPDYSEIVKGGEFQFTTNIEYPFEMTEVEGQRVARSTINGQYGSSQLTVTFSVPEDNIGTLSWKGVTTNNSYWYCNAGGVFVDDMGTPVISETGTADISRSIELGPGEHTVRFQYDGYQYTGDEANGLYVYDLELVNTPAEALSVVIETPDIDFGNFLIRDDNGVAGNAVIVIRNKGTEPLSIASAESDNEAFLIDALPDTSAGLLETISLPITFTAKEAGEYEGVITIWTSAGTVTANVKAFARRMADFSALVTEGLEYVTSFDTNETAPFEMDGETAYNANSGEADTTPTQAWVQINFTVPAGKAAIISWDGHSYGHAQNPEMEWDGDYSYFEYMHPMNSGSNQCYGEDKDCGSDVQFGDEFWADKLTCIPGDHYFKFQFSKNGDGLISEKDRLEISNFKIHLVDFPEHGVEADTYEVEFEPTYVGENRYMTAVVNLKNTGSEVLEITGEESSHPFYGVVPEYAKAQYNQTVQVGLWFFPSEEGDFNGGVTFQTNAGDVVINCHGTTKPMEGILLCGDVEDDAYGWSFYDADADGNCWSLGYSLWGDAPQWVHSGHDCFGSNSYTYDADAIKPDNWLFSPVITIPADGAMLQWYAAAHHHERYAENYSVYVVDPEEIADPANLDNQTALFSETLEPEAADVWQERTLDLAEYADQNVQIAFRHHDCDGQYVLKIDDIFVFDMEKWASLGVENIGDSFGEAVSTEIYDLNGIRLNSLTEGVNIVRVTYSDGTVKTHKIIVRK